MMIRKTIIILLASLAFQASSASAASVEMTSADQTSNCASNSDNKSIRNALEHFAADLNNNGVASDKMDLFSKDAVLYLGDKVTLDYDKISQNDVQNCHVNEVPVPDAAWLFVSALLGFMTFTNRRRI